MKISDYNSSLKIISISLIILGSLPLSGCFEQQSLRDIAIVAGMGIDVVAGEADENGGDRMLITVEIADAAEANGNQTTSGSRILTYQGKTIADAIAGLSNQINKKLFWGHVQIVVVGKDAMDRGVKTYEDFFLKNQQISPMTDLVYTDGKATELLAAACGLSSSASLGMTQMLDNQNDASGGLITALTIQGMAEKMLAPATAILIPQVELHKSESTKGGEKEVRFEGMAVVGKDGMFKARLEKEVNLGALLWLNAVDNFTLSVADNINTYSFSISNWKLKRNWVNTKEVGLKLQLKISFDAVLAEGPVRSELSVGGAEAIKTLYEDRIRDALLSAWAECLALNEDFLLIGDDMRRHQVKEWQRSKSNWPEGMKNLSIEILLDSKFKAEEK